MLLPYYYSTDQSFRRAFSSSSSSDTALKYVYQIVRSHLELICFSLSNTLPAFYPSFFPPSPLSFYLHPFLSLPPFSFLNHQNKINPMISGVRSVCFSHCLSSSLFVIIFDDDDIIFDDDTWHKTDSQKYFLGLIN